HVRELASCRQHHPIGIERRDAAGRVRRAPGPRAGGAFGPTGSPGSKPVLFRRRSSPRAKSLRARDKLPSTAGSIESHFKPGLSGMEISK
ncbi:hypothetical protein QMA69_29890, partial [Burkholderia pseudomallei]|nr:hypothetical protein [Burkholderia pseudomallei]